MNSLSFSNGMALLMFSVDIHKKIKLPKIWEFDTVYALCSLLVHLNDSAI